MASFKDLTGMRFGRWLVVRRADDVVGASGYKRVMWECICDCGNKKVICGKSLACGASKSCGCLQREQLSARAGKHNGFGTRLYHVWNSMRQRCNNKHSAAYANYGARGIAICDEWDDFGAFREWALENGYDETAERGRHTLDRIDVNKGYSPENCRFVDMRTQTNNRRESIIVERDGESRPLSEWAELLNISYQTLWRRYHDGRDIFKSK